MISVLTRTIADRTKGSIWWQCGHFSLDWNCYGTKDVHLNIALSKAGTLSQMCPRIEDFWYEKAVSWQAKDDQAKETQSLEALRSVQGLLVVEFQLCSRELGCSSTGYSNLLELGLQLNFRYVYLLPFQPNAATSVNHCLKAVASTVGSSLTSPTIR